MSFLLFGSDKNDLKKEEKGEEPLCFNACIPHRRSSSISLPLDLKVYEKETEKNDGNDDEYCLDYGGSFSSLSTVDAHEINETINCLNQHYAESRLNVRRSSSPELMEQWGMTGTELSRDEKEETNFVDRLNRKITEFCSTVLCCGIESSSFAA